MNLQDTAEGLTRGLLSHDTIRCYTPDTISQSVPVMSLCKNKERKLQMKADDLFFSEIHISFLD